MYTCNICTFRAGFQFGRIHCEPEGGRVLLPENVNMLVFLAESYLEFLYRLCNLLSYHDNIDIVIIW